ncbi:hypothetical protein BH10BAC5_BH10BAC5_19630 [soil metagenome]
MKYVLLLLLLISNIAITQDNGKQLLEFPMQLRGLQMSDLSIPVNFDRTKSPTGSKLIMNKVKEIMTDPSKSFDFLDEVEKYKSMKVYDILKEQNILIGSKNITGSNIKNNISDLVKYCKSKQVEESELLKIYSGSDIAFLNKNLFSIISDEDNDDNNSDIFKFNAARDSSLKISKVTMELLDKFNNSPLAEDISYKSFLECYEIYLSLNSDWVKLQKKPEYIKNDKVEGYFYFYYDQDGVTIAVGDGRKNVYHGWFNFIIDMGGDDDYNISQDKLIGNNFNCIIDMGGNDSYYSNSDFALGGAVFSQGFIFDRSGNDTYRGKNGSIGAAICGLGAIVDEGGDDFYSGNIFAVGAGCFGSGIVYDESGNDIYSVNAYGEAFGMTMGTGVIVDKKGNDSYLINAKSLDIGRYEDHYVSMVQGYGLGLRPYYGGGIGILLDCEGNDIYNADIFGQGGSYWYSLGVLLDLDGHDKYNGYQYCQGAGIHLSVGLLKDKKGWDFYNSDGVSQGCGHDLGFGLLYDVSGNDNYSAYSLSQGAGNANGIGVLLDESGRDGYLNKEPGNSIGYGNPRREYGSLGIFVDNSGNDFYSVSGLDSMYADNSYYGVRVDNVQADIPQQNEVSNFKITFQPERDYSLDELFTMAKTIEPRFSKQQEYGFNKLVEDSINTSSYLVKYLDTEDHRASLVLRNLAFKIGTSISQQFRKMLDEYINGNPKEFNTDQVSFMCYLFGETGNPSGKEQLYKLTFDNNIRVRSSAINALGKIKYDKSDSEFMNKTAQRLLELAKENDPGISFNKDIAFALGNYYSPAALEAIKILLKNNYYGSRFTAGLNFRKYLADEMYVIGQETVNELAANRLSLQQLIFSLSDLPSEKVLHYVKLIQNTDLTNDEIIKYNLVELINRKVKEKESVSNAELITLMNSFKVGMVLKPLK